MEINRINIDKTKLRQINLQFFASAESEGRTEKATSKRRSDARSEGQVAKSQEIGVAFSTLIVFWAMRIFGPMMYRNLQEVFYYSLSLVQEVDQQFSVTRITGLVVFLATRMGVVLAPILATAFAVAFIANYIQVGWKPTTKPLKPKLNKFNPVTGFKKIFSIKSLMEIPKSLGKVFIIGYIIYSGLKDEANNILAFLDMSLEQGLAYIADVSINLGIKVGAWYMLIAAADYFYARYKHEEQLKMTKQQIKDEHKNSEGDPKIKAKIKHKMFEISMRRMMSDVPSADVIITNPTHYAVALKYDKSKGIAPILVAKGVDFMAAKIKKVAAENKVHIVENRHLARSLYSAVEIGQEIPEELYQAVAEILAYVYSIKNPA